MFAVTSVWNISEKNDIAASLTQIKDVGFGAVEAGYNLTSQRLDEFFRLTRDQGIKIVSAHNFCPLPPKGPRRYYCDYYRLSSQRLQEAQAALRFTEGTIDAAARMGIPVVVIHAGMVEVDHRRVRNLFDLYRQGKRETQEFADRKNEILMKRRELAPAFLATFAGALKDLLAYAAERQVILALENRYYPHEIPSVDEFEQLFSDFAAAGLAYWHDTGHAEVARCMGFISGDEYLGKFSPYLVGMHLHDVRGIDDHLAPFSGEVDFTRWEKYLKSDSLIKVVEAHPKATAAEMRFALEKLRQLSEK